MSAICAVVVILFIANAIWLVIQLVGAPEGAEIPGVGFVNLRDNDGKD